MWLTRMSLCTGPDERRNSARKKLLILTTEISIALTRTQEGTTFPGHLVGLRTQHTLIITASKFPLSLFPIKYVHPSQLLSKLMKPGYSWQTSGSAALPMRTVVFSLGNTISRLPLFPKQSSHFHSSIHFKAIMSNLV